ncbi:MAG: oligopeptide ABC transporter permease [Longimicrobiales bacterium]
MTDDAVSRHDPRREALPDPESAAPVPIPVPEEQAAPEAERVGAAPVSAPPEAPGPVRRPSTLAIVLSVILPGSGHLASGMPFRGMAFLFPWCALLGLLYWARVPVLAVPARGSLDDWVALATIAAALFLLWWLALRDLLIAGRRAAEPGGDSQWRIAGRHFRKNKVALVGLGVVVVFYLVALLAPFISPDDPISQDILNAHEPPGAGHLFGTDLFGRDILSRIIYGARISLSIGFIATAISVTLGTLIGAVAGYLGGRVDTVLMRFTDMVLAFPRLVLLILIVALFEPSIAVIIIVLGLTQWPGTTRIVRGDVLSLREREFVQAARALGMSQRRIVLRHLIPNVLAPVIVTATLGIGNTIVLEAGLSFLGLGPQPPTPSWGNMVAAGKDTLLTAWWEATFPGLTIVLVVLAFNLVGDGLRDALDPRLRT